LIEQGIILRDKLNKMIARLKQSYNSHRIIYFLGAILLLGFLFRIINLDVHDAYTDEVLYGFRAIGMIDYVTAIDQKSPWEWFGTPPWWARLSFHDHPPLVIATQHIATQIMGTSLFAVRFPSVIAGLLTIFLVYLLGKEIFSRRVGLIAATLLSVQSYHIWISRLGLQESIVIALILLAIWLWIQATKNDKKWYLWLLWGGALGLSVLAKYSVGVLIPIFIIHALIYRHRVYKSIWFWGGLGLCVVVTSPILIYNLFLYRAVGHFDFQISTLLGQDTPNWPTRLGRERVGDLATRFKFFFIILHRANSWIFNLLFSFATVTSVCLYLKKKDKGVIFLVSITIIQALWFLVIGSTNRFIVMIVPWAVLLVAFVINYFLERKNLKIITIIFFIIVCILEMVFAINSFFISEPRGIQNITYAEIKNEVENKGFSQLDKYLTEELRGSYSAISSQANYLFLTKLQKNGIEKNKQRGELPRSLIIIFHHDLDSLAILWSVRRHLIYGGWFVMPDNLFLSITGDQKEEYYKSQGVQEFIYISPASSDVLDPETPNIEVPDPLKEYLKTKNILPKDSIINSNGDDAFYIYKF